MSRVTVTISPMADFRDEAIRQVNERYNQIARANLHRDHAHFIKRTLAAQIIEGGYVPAEFADEAALRNITPLDLANLINSKPNEAAQRELNRQRELLAIAAATTPADLPQG
ncbi:hypothetical protein SAMN03159423_4883 [Bradyrhizobium sp. NFR13]|nr:hypothetical protein SAMN03159423_4883 [Bradyrhizobium sp. NFR13]